ncbi:MAG: T9SS type A sorting domain-containing protein, partial [Gaiellaceae bacterium]
QHLGATGTAATGWPAAGAVILPGSTNVAGISAVRDGSGRLDVVWRCEPDSSGVRLMAAKLDPSTVPAASIAAGAITLSSGAIENSEPRLVRCADGSLLIGWAALEGTSALLKIQRLDANGALASGWPLDGATLATTAAIASPALLPISSGGAFVAWEDHRTAGSPDIFASRIDGDGTRNASWDSSGVAVCTAAGVQYSPGLSSDGNGAAIVVWNDASLDASGSYLAVRQVTSDPTQLLRVETNSEFAKLTWAVPTAEGESYQAYRADAAGEWSLLSNITPDDSSHAVLEDRAAPGGAEVQYRLAIQAQGVIRFLTPVTVKVPGDPTRLELTRARPAPGHDGIEIAFALPRGPSARVDIFDVMGRRVGEAALDRFPPGTHEMRVPMSPRPASGVYFVRLTQGAKSNMRKVVFLK